MSLGLRVEVVPSRYAELPLANVAPRDLAIAHARGKAAGASPAGCLIVAADTVVDLDGVALGKPQDSSESRSIIERLSGREHDVHTAFTLRDDGLQRTLVHCETTRVTFRVLDTPTIDGYVASGDGMDKAGAYGIQGFAATLVERIAGDYFTVVGFPLAAFARLLPDLNYVLQAPRASVDAAAERGFAEVSA